MNSVYTGNGIIYTNPYIPAWASNPPNYMEDKTNKSCKIDIRNKAVEALNVPPMAGFVAMGVIKVDNSIVFTLATTSGIELYTYDQTTGQCSISPVVTT